MWAALFLILCVTVPREQVLRDVVDVIEVNHHVDSESNIIFDQWIAWRWCSVDSHYRVAAWRMMRSVRDTKQVAKAPDGWVGRPKWKGGHATPIRRHDRGGWWISSWWDDVDRVHREVAAPMFRETWTLYDPEVLDRAFLPKDCRQGLLRSRQ